MKPTILALTLLSTGVLMALAPAASATPPAPQAERLQARAMAQFQQARFADAYGRFVSLADAGYAPAAGMALWMHANRAELRQGGWDATPAQLQAWAALAGSYALPSAASPGTTAVASAHP